MDTPQAVRFVACFLCVLHTVGMSHIDGFALDLADRTGYVRGLAQELGFDFCRFVPIGDAPHSSFFSAWLARGGGADMAYLGRHVDKRGSPGLLARGGQQFRSMIGL
ncbi:MAG: hypothetical protein R2856_17170 [Caldilineaceae bacterium]